MKELCDAYLCGYCKHGKCRHPLASGLKYPMPYCHNYKEFKRREASIITIPYGKLDREYFWDTNFPPEPVQPPKVEKHQEPRTEPERKMAKSINLKLPDDPPIEIVLESFSTPKEISCKKCGPRAAQPKEEKQMHRITITLKCGKTISWDTGLSTTDAMSQCTKYGTKAVDGREIIIKDSEIASEEVMPLIKCHHCGRFVLPDMSTARTPAGDKYHAEICPECGAEV